MDRWPAELWDEVARFACIDGGYTGCSLALVSRFMHDAIRHSRHHSVALVSEHNLLAFARRALEGDRAPARIAHLFIAVDLTAGMGPEGQKPSQAIEDAFAAILACAAPSLQSLTVYSQWKRADVFIESLCESFTFPGLRDLVLPAPVPLPAASAFPALRRFHGYSVADIETYTVVEVIAPAFPSISHLRFSEPPPHRASSFWAHETSGTEYDLDLGDVADALPHLRAIIVPRYPWRPTTLDEDYRVARHSSNRRNRRRGAGPEPSYLRSESTGYGVVEARIEWLDLVAGGEGPWSTKHVEQPYIPGR